MLYTSGWKTLKLHNVSTTRFGHFTWPSSGCILAYRITALRISVAEDEISFAMVRYINSIYLTIVNEISSSVTPVCNAVTL